MSKNPIIENAKRNRGAQPGNTNALKHGFYSRSFRKSDIESLINLPNGVEAEINMLRLVIQRVVDLSGLVTTLDEGLRLLNTLGRASAYLDRLIRTQRTVFGDVPPSTKDLKTWAMGILFTPSEQLEFFTRFQEAGLIPPEETLQIDPLFGPDADPPGSKNSIESNNSG